MSKYGPVCSTKLLEILAHASEKAISVLVICSCQCQCDFLGMLLVQASTYLFFYNVIKLMCGGYESAPGGPVERRLDEF